MINSIFDCISCVISAIGIFAIFWAVFHKKAIRKWLFEHQDEIWARMEEIAKRMQQFWRNVIGKK